MKSVSALTILQIIACCGEATAGGRDASSAFAERGTPFLTQYCGDCHTGNDAEAGVALDELKSGDDLLHQHAITDRILKMLEFSLMPPAEAEQPPRDEIDAFAQLVSTALQEALDLAPPNPGHVTMRRLNRTEYANTIRDLLGVDYDPTENFPADGVGYGFDNMGDVLSLSPLLMEQYLTAAESIVEQAFSRVSRVPPRRVLKSFELQPWGFEDRSSRFRPIHSHPSAKDHLSGPIVGTFSVPPGRYRFLTQVTAEAPEDQLVRIAILACCDEWDDEAAMQNLTNELCGSNWDALGPFRLMKTEEVVSRDILFPRDPTVTIPELPGFDQVAVALYRPKDDEEPVVCHVGWFTLDGPLDESQNLFRAKLDRLKSAPAPTQTRGLLTWLLGRAFRRPPAEAELARYAGLIAGVQAQGGSWEDGVAAALQAVLVSPKFLFRTETQPDDQQTEPQPLTEFQLASRLSYFLWSTMPDDELFDLAARGQLREHLSQHVHRMLADGRSEALIDNFVMQWLQLRKLEHAAPDPTLFPSFDNTLRQSMLTETRLFAQAMIREDRSVVDFLGSDFTFMNEVLARHYGVADTSGRPLSEESGGTRSLRLRGPEFQRVHFDDNRRGGVLRQAAVLTATSNPTRTSPVKRGHWVLQQLLGSSPPPPPPGVPELDSSSGPAVGTLRERMEQHRRDPRCASCHAQMDPIGFAFENYDAIGRFRRFEDGQPIDVSGELPGGETFDGPAELIDLLKQQREPFVRCLAEQMLTYALGRGLEYYDRRAVDRIVEHMAENDDRFSALVTAIIFSEPFQLRSGLASE